jgi:signal peptidase I
VAGRRKASKSEQQLEREQEQASEDEQAALGRRIWDQVGPLLIAVLIALGIRATVIESFYVPSESMLPTLLIGDHVFVNKFVYGAKIPFTDVHLPSLRDPERGEIVVFSLGRKGPIQICPRDECPAYPVENFVKRIAAVPGDRIEYRRDVFYLNGEPVPANPTGEMFVDESGGELIEKRAALGSCYHDVLDHPRRQGLTHEAFTVPEGRYYFLGDNRDNSNDSRKWGTVPRTDLKGPVIVNYWSWNNQESWPAMLNPFTWVRLLWGEMRWDRIGKTHACEEQK